MSTQHVFLVVALVIFAPSFAVMVVGLCQAARTPDLIFVNALPACLTDELFDLAATTGGVDSRPLCRHVVERDSGRWACVAPSHPEQPDRHYLTRSTP